MAIQAKNVIFLLKNPNLLFKKIQGEFWTLFNPNMPWISPKAIDYCEEILNPNMNLFEWGSGRSTLWFAKRVKHATSIEHHQGWLNKVQELVTENNLKNVDLRFIPLDHPENEPTYAHYDILPKYVDAINKNRDEMFDFVIIDGAYRMACVVAAIPRIKPGGYLLIDNSNWMPLKNWGVPENWKVVHSSLGFEGATTIWQKP